jgi:hypothetical protein
MAVLLPTYLLKSGEGAPQYFEVSHSEKGENEIYFFHIG